MDRPDVVSSTQQALWLSSGFRLPLRLPNDLGSSALPLRMQITIGDGRRFDLELSEQARQVKIPSGERRPSIKAQLALALAALLPFGYLLLSYSRYKNSLGAPGFTAAVLASFTLLVAGGWSGSSLPLLLDRAKILEHDGANFIGNAQDVRRDEWLIITPMAMSQTTEPKRFAATNPLLGEYGQNTNVVGMTSTPTMGLESLAKPSTWGFFAFDLKRALAWYWWLPFYGCFLALWALLRIWLKLEWRQAAVLAVLVPGSAYAVGWSGWPAYVSFFPILASLSFTQLLAGPSKIKAMGYGVLTGWAAAGFALVLYPGWQIPLAYLFAILTSIHLWQNRARLQLGLAQVSGLVVAVGVAGVLMLAWWTNAQDAVRALNQTVYPGQRSMELGGYIDPWHMTKGLTNLVTLYESSPWSIPSDAAGCIYLLIPLAVLSLLHICIKRKLAPLVTGLWLCIAFVLVHMFVGIPAWLAQATLWGRVPAVRLDVVLVLAQTLMLGYFMKEASTVLQWAESSPSRMRALQVLGCATAIAFAGYNGYCFTLMPAPMQDWLSPAVITVVLMGSALLGYLVVRGQVWRATVLTALWTLTVSLPFNPVHQAPKNIQLVPSLRTLLSTASHSPPRVAVVDVDLWMSALPISGVGVVNSFFYDPPHQLWQDLDPEGRLQQIHNRYQFLQIKLSPDLADADFQASSPRMDAVTLSVHPQRFDFNRLHADFVLAKMQDAPLLQKNPRLQLAGSDGENWTLFRTIRP